MLQIGILNVHLSFIRLLYVYSSESKMMEDYTFIDRLGHGSFGKVWKAKRNSDGKTLAIKEINYSSLGIKERKMFVNEVNILRKLHNPYIVRYYDHYINRSEKKIFLIMELCAGGDLQTFIRETRSKLTTIGEDQIWLTFSELALALKDCHYGPSKVLHRDIKPGNVFIDSEGHVKLGDFGLARCLNSTVDFATTCIGTPFYMSPEMNNGKYDEKSDIWALGCVVYEMAALRAPFQGFGIEDLKKHICKGDLQRFPDQYSDALWKIVSRMLDKDPAKRPTVLDILNYRNVALTVKMNKVRKELENVREKTADLMKKKQRLMRRGIRKNRIEM
ncbi:AGC family protein kinase [Tritrichomonas foetus]|uniref:non-specific serine/threonine protein kinase n=1 Tax=Tritrichomonas foetus TaxID=1144522 RepID=A0A1J4L352_9EUKA|nr:AGC family protein kinase [Tritrichomonas foetus]|eukprot:OHT16382.1 AGC family protein kinase [Tritrichomonas foetus]